MSSVLQAIDKANALLTQVKLAALHDSAIPEYLEQELFDILVNGYVIAIENNWDEKRSVGLPEMGDQDDSLPSNTNIFKGD